MNALPSLLVLWSLFTATFLALLLYRSHLTRHEVDQVFLNDNIDGNLETEHDDIVRRVNRIHPFVQTAGGAAALLTVAMVGIYVANVLPNVRF